MTRRIALAILICVWSMLLFGGVAAYFSVQSILIGDLDSLLYARAVALPELIQGGSFDPAHTPQYDWSDTYTIIHDPTRPPGKYHKPVLLDARFTQSAKGIPERTLRIAATSHSRESGPIPVIVAYSGSIAHIDLLLRRIRWALFGFVAVASLVTAAVSIRVSRLVLRPLSSTASEIGTIDEQRLSVRIPTSGMPCEFVPVVQQLNDLLERLERAFAGQKRFVASASHELRTPVAALATTLEIAERRERDPERYRQTIAQCLSQVQVLHVLVERLMEHVSDEAFNDEEPREIDVAALADQCLDAAAALGEAKNIEIVRTGPRPLWCLLPPNRMRSVIMNLLGNAVDHSHPGGRVEMTWMHDGANFRARIADDGPGIAPEHLPHLFTPFYRANKSHQQRGHHLGLGLFIVQSHLKAMHGTCRVESRPNEGAAFAVEIPCRQVDAPAPAASELVSTS